MNGNFSIEQALKVEAQSYYQMQLCTCLDQTYQFQEAPEISLIVQLLLKNFQERTVQYDMLADTNQITKQQDQLLQSFKQQLTSIKQRNSKIICKVLNLRQRLTQKTPNSSNQNRKMQISYQQLIEKIRKLKSDLSNKIQRMKTMQKSIYKEKQQSIKLDTPLFELKNGIELMKKESENIKEQLKQTMKYLSNNAY